MSAMKAPLRALAAPLRSFASSSRIALPAAEDAPSRSGETGFGALMRNLTKSPAASAQTTGTTPLSSPSSHTPERVTASRSYPLDAIPPKIDPLLDIFTNMLMKHGRKAEAQKHVSEILEMLQRTANSPPQPLLARAIFLSSPFVRLNSSRKRAKVVQTPKALDERQRTRQGIVWLLKAAERGRKGGLPRDQRIAREVFAVLEGSSDVYKWVEERHRLATANRSNLNSR